MKTFTYTYPTNSYYSESMDEDFYDTADFDYEVEDDEIKHALAVMMFNSEFKKLFLNDDKVLKKLIVKALESIIAGYDLQDKLEKELEDDLKEFFRDKAFKSMND